jgi:GNAT superfamily N-acetyltransferase
MFIKPLSHQQDFLMAFPVMKQLRPHIEDEQQFIEQIQRMQMQDYVLVAMLEADEIIGLAGYRIQENLLYGRFLYVDDLVVTESHRSSGCGARLLHAVMEIAKQQNCHEFVLDTGLSMSLAQKFYFRQGLLTQAIRFRNELSQLV